METKSNKIIASGKCGENLTWVITGEEDNYTLSISGTGEMENFNAHYPSWNDYRRIIKTIEINSGVTSIGNSVFESCSRLTSITIPDSVTSIEDSAFKSCSELINIIVNTDNLNYTSIDGVLFDKSQNTLLQCPIGKTGNYTVPDTVTSIGDADLLNKRKTKELILLDSSSMRNWRKSYFGRIDLMMEEFAKDCKNTNPNQARETSDHGCNRLASITIPDSVTFIGYNAFEDCRGLAEIHVKAQTPLVLEDNIFSEVPDIVSVYVPYGSKEVYERAEGWNDFDIIEDAAEDEITK
jgi:hypothetical protein